MAFLLVQLHRALRYSFKSFIKWENFGLEPDHFLLYIWNFPIKINNCMKYALYLSKPMIDEVYYYIKSTQLQRNVQHFLNK